MLATGATTLLAEEKLAEALTRLQGLPIPLPDSIYRAFAAVTATERRSQIHAGLRAGESPVAIMHLLRLLTCGVLGAQPLKMAPLFIAGLLKTAGMSVSVTRGRVPVRKV